MLSNNTCLNMNTLYQLLFEYKITEIINLLWLLLCKIGRSEERCKEAVTKLQKEGFSPKCHTLDLDDQSTITKFRDFIKENYGGIDVLVNNAGIAYKVGFVHVQVSEWLLFNTNLAIFQLYHGENKLIFNEMMMIRSTLF